ncbi:uncharacterized protein LOC105703464 [Orussus abietinus]|uniref:uncharacterized protein LOC105703464 n=1 Tax=Orussus abietinus TaxID=222816 RepID=UPI000626245B|nr:uncharacterized protein LOC105703464 [Orussus abietinus]
MDNLLLSAASNHQNLSESRSEETRSDTETCNDKIKENSGNGPSPEGNVTGPRKLFKELYHGKVTLSFPDETWGIHRNRLPNKSVIISQAKLLDQLEPPQYIKQIIFRDDMRFSVFLYSRVFVDASEWKIPETFEELGLYVCTRGSHSCPPVYPYGAVFEGGGSTNHGYLVPLPPLIPEVQIEAHVIN